jgi:hypothetical protein
VPEGVSYFRLTSVFFASFFLRHFPSGLGRSFSGVSRRGSCQMVPAPLPHGLCGIINLEKISLQSLEE